MPTGYTCDVQSGKITEFKDFAIQCARAFGACIMMRDDPMDKPIPEKFEPSTYSRDRIEEAQKEWDEWQKMSREQRLAAYQAAKEKDIAYAEKQIANAKVERKRYEKMLAKVHAFVPPSSEHYKFKEFMIQQLTDSIEWDCSSKYWEDQKNFPPFEEWVKKHEKHLIWNVDYHTKEWREEQERTESRNRWIRQLREALS